MGELRLTYAELGERLGLKPGAARQRAKRRQREGRWRIIVDNTGRAVVHVDEADLAGETAGRSPDHRPNVHPNVHPDVPPIIPERPGDDQGELVAELRDRVRSLEASIEASRGLVDQLVEARERAGKAEGETAALRNALADLANRLDQATAELRELRRPWWRRWLA